MRSCNGTLSVLIAALLCTAQISASKHDQQHRVVNRIRAGRTRAYATEASVDDLRSQQRDATSLTARIHRAYTEPTSGQELTAQQDTHHDTHDAADVAQDHAHVSEGEMSVATGVLNLVADLCPHGMLPVAFGIAAAGGTGTLAGPALLALFGATSAYTMISLGRAAERTGQYSFAGIWTDLIGKRSAWVIEVAFAVMTFGCLIFYSAFIGDLFAALARTVPSLPALLQHRSTVLCVLAAFPLLPLCLMRNLSALQPTSFGGLIAILYTVWFVVKRALDGTYATGGRFFDAIDPKYANPLKDSWGSVGLWRVGPGTVTLMNMACVAFMAHYNGVKYYEELEHRTVKKYAWGISSGVAICFSVFATIMLFGFKTFGTSAQTLLLNNYHRTDDTLATCARLATGFAILCGYPLMFAALKTSGLNAAYEISSKFKATRKLSSRFLTDQPLRDALCVVALSIITAIACNKTEEDVALVVGLIGALLGGGANFVIPALLNLRIFKRDGTSKGLFSEATLNRLLIAAGLVFMVVGTVSVLNDAKHGHH